MSLRLSLILVLWLVTAGAGLGVLAWTTAEAYRAAALDTRTTLARAGEVLERNYRMDADATGPSDAERTSIALLSVMAPGTCVTFEQGPITARRLCAGWQVFGPIPPDWFRKASARFVGLPEPMTRAGTASQSRSYALEARFDPVAAATLAWGRVRLALGQTLAMAAGVLLIGTGTILHRLRPVQDIVEGIGGLAAGDLSARVRPGGAREFRRIGTALNGLARQLDDAAARQRGLTRKLIEVEDVERRQLARDLHDEFGQTLTATGALAASIALAAGPERADLSRDARAISANIRAMMESLRGAFARLRPPDLEEVGLTASLRAMLSGWSAERRTRLTLSADLGDAPLPGPVALDVYRIVQECVTNAMRHGTPSRVEVALERRDNALRLRVEDDGCGTLAGAEAGHGILGIRERVAAMGGALSMTSIPGGVRVEVMVPLDVAVRAA